MKYLNNHTPRVKGIAIVHMAKFVSLPADTPRHPTNPATATTTTTETTETTEYNKEYRNELWIIMSLEYADLFQIWEEYIRDGSNFRGLSI